MNKSYRILFVTNDVYPNLNANSLIAYRLAEMIQKEYNSTVEILGISNTDVLKETNSYNIKTHTIESISKYKHVVKTSNTLMKRLVKILSNPEALRYYIGNKIARRKGLLLEYQIAVCRLLKSIQYDCVVVFSEPSVIPEAISRMRIKIPYIIYQLDPWSSSLLCNDRDAARKKEKWAYSKAACIVVTDLIYHDCIKYLDDNICSKMFVLPFPNVVFIDRDKNRQLCYDHSEKIHCVFAGNLDNLIRSPKYCVNIFSQFENDNIILHIYGSVNGENVFPEVLPKNVIYHGRVSTEEAMAFMQDADILVNIGNSVSNQLPSKILTYISLGKPILNTIKIEECPTLSYTEKYPLALNIKETEIIRNEDIQLIKEFIKMKVGNCVPFSEIKKLYRSCTPEYVSQQLYEHISASIKKKCR